MPALKIYDAATALWKYLHTSSVGGGEHVVDKTVTSPQLVYASRPQIPLFQAPVALHITRIHIHGNDATPTTELAGDLKKANDLFDGSFASAVVIDVCDTTSGVKTITTGFDDAAVAAGQYVYFQMDASPHADWKDILFHIRWTPD